MKKSVLVLSCLLTGSAIASTNVSLDADAQSKSQAEAKVSRLSVGLSSSFLQNPGVTKDTQRFHGAGLEVQREIVLSEGYSTNTILNLDLLGQKIKTGMRDDFVNRTQNADSSVRLITIGQSIEKHAETKIGTVTVGAMLGLAELQNKVKLDWNTEDLIDPSLTNAGIANLEYKLYGQTIGLSAKLTLANGIIPYVSYRSFNFNQAQGTANYRRLGENANRTSTVKVNKSSAQMISLGVGYLF